ncbi:MAG TPA: cytochrome c oxidase assembly protein [Streptosporangiaceae bacterium]|jgi:cytochrome c oxidase assembly factor CtaG
MAGAGAGVLAAGGGYHGPPGLTLLRAVTSWTFDPWAFVIIVLLAAAYLAGVRKLRGSGRPWPRARSVSFLGLGLGALFLATMWWTGVYAGVLFYARAAQTILLLLVAPMFLALGRPLSLAVATLPGRAGPRLAATIASRTARALTFPAISTVVLIAVPFAVYFTPWYTAFFHSGAVRGLTYLALMAPGFVFFWTLVRVDPVPKAYPYLVTLWITITEVVGDAVLGIAVAGDSHLIGGAYYHALARPWGPSLRLDQALGGGTLWVLGDLVGLPFLVAQLFHMIKEDESEAAEIDAELDAREARAAAVRQDAPVTVPADTPAQAGTPESQAGTPKSQAADPVPPDRPWWESDPRFTERFGRVGPRDQ